LRHCCPHLTSSHATSPSKQTSHHLQLREVEGHDEEHARDASCAAIATLWTHHLTSAMQEEAKALLHSLPLLPSAEREEPHLEDTTQVRVVVESVECKRMRISTS
jgi:hypothetical protein